MFDRLLSTIDEHYGRSTREEFFEPMRDAGFARLFSLPLLAERPEESQLSPARLESLDMPRLSELRVLNRSAQAMRIEARVDFSREQDLEALFRAFSHASHNAITLGDFRREPQYHARLYSSASYFLFHGDGFCSSLAFLFQGLANYILGDKVELRYCRTPDSFYTHAYGLSEDLFVDPALKSFWPLSDLGKRVPTAWFYTLVKRAGMKRWYQLPESDRAWLFSRSVRENLDAMNEGNFQLVYRADARLAEVHRIFLDTVRDRSEELSLFRDDYDWKRAYREEAKVISGREDAPFFSRLSEPVAIELPPGASLDIGGPRPSTPELFRLLTDVFFGRTLARLRVPVMADGTASLRTPDLPWMIESKGSAFMLNGQRVPFSDSSLAPARRFIGLSTLAPLAKLEDDSPSPGYIWKIEGATGGFFDLWFPVNALTWNSAWLKLSAEGEEGGLTVSAVYGTD